jgi:hypothetical protein
MALSYCDEFKPHASSVNKMNRDNANLPKRWIQYIALHPHGDFSLLGGEKAAFKGVLIWTMKAYDGDGKTPKISWQNLWTRLKLLGWN